jgi:sirohydrochlorin ferrochelatase
MRLQLQIVSRPSIFLVDNGSLRPQASFSLRALAEKLSEFVGAQIEPVSLLHSHKIDPKDLDGEPATIVKRRMRERIAQGQRKFVILPLFLGPSLAIADYLPEIVGELSRATPGLQVRIAAPLGGSDVECPDPRLAGALSQLVLPLISGDPKAKIALVDHGSPIRPVSRLRDVVAGQLARLLGRPVQPCSMERREGDAYAFNDPLLENLGEIKSFTGGRLVLAMFFLLPGRHAGEGGDVSTIAGGLVEKGHFDEVAIAPLLGRHDLLLEILRDRLGDAIALGWD